MELLAHAVFVTREAACCLSRARGQDSYNRLQLYDFLHFADEFAARHQFSRRRFLGASH